jgi:NAD(P)-dependent dehydrogenase (short-subunit alcohol dehydrogenase family)
MSTRLSGKPIAVTGASSGIGWATALACARAGMPVAVAARRKDRLDSLVARIVASGGRAVAVACDVTRPEDCTRLIDAALEKFGSIHAVFANAGQAQYGPIADLTNARLREIFEVNFFGTLHALRPALPHMLAAGSGHLLVCSSCLSRFPMPWHGAYSATKAAQEHVTRALRVELRGTGVYASSIHPVGTDTEFFERSPPDTGGAPRPPAFFLQRPERVAAAVVRCLRRPRPEVWTSHAARLGFALASLLPRTTEWALRRLPAHRINSTTA